MSRLGWRRSFADIRRPLAGAAATAAVAAVLGMAVTPQRAPARVPSPAAPLLPLLFLPNVGQAPSEFSYAVHNGGIAIGFKRSGLVLGSGKALVEVTFSGANPASGPEGLRRLGGRVNFLLGPPAEWKTDVAAFEGVIYRDLFPGVDLAYTGEGGRFKSEFRVAPGGGAGRIRLAYSGIRRLRTAGGALLVDTGFGQLREERPEAYQEAGGRRTPVEVEFQILEAGVVGFRLGAYDASQPLVIDPVLSYSTYLGGGGLDSVKAIAVDGAGNAYVAGQTDSTDFPTASPLQGQSGGGVDAFVAKLNVSGNSLIYCTYLGGSWDDRAFGIAVDAGGNAYVTGWTYSSNFPTTSGARQRVLGGGRDAFVAKLNPSGNGLVYSTYLGGSGYDSGNAIALDGSGPAYVAGETNSTNFPVANGFRMSNQGRQDAFVAKLNSTGSGLVWSTYLGGSGDDRAAALAVDASGNAYLTGATSSANFPTLNAIQPSIGGGQDAFVTKLNAGGGWLGFSTFLGGSGGTTGAIETGAAIRIDGAGNVYVAGTTSSADFPTVSALQPLFAGGGADVFVAKLNPFGTGLLYSTYLGGVGQDFALALGVDTFERVTVAGYTSSSNFPLENPLQASKGAGYDGFAAQLDSAGSGLEFASYFGGNDNDSAQAAFVDAPGSVWFAGQTLSSTFPVKNPVQPLNPGGLSGFVAKLGEPAPAAAFRSPAGAIYITTYGSTVIRSAGGYLTGDPSLSQNAAGDSFVAAANGGGQIWMNIFENSTQSWKGWIYAGAGFTGSPAVAASADGGAYLVARDTASQYRIQRYTPATSLQGWLTLGGSFASDPVVAVRADGTVYVVGRTTTGIVQSGRYLPGAGFQGWVSGGGSPAGKPALTIGSDGAAYVAIRATSGSLWMARLDGDVWGTWYTGGGTLATDPQAAADGGIIYAVIRSGNGGTYVKPFREGTGNGWQDWIFTGGYLDSMAIAARKGRYFVAGRNAANELWWHQSGGAGWVFLGYRDQVTGNFSAGPR